MVYSKKVMEEEIKHISETDAEFPNCLRTIPSRPKELYLRGKLNLTAPCVAVVGARVPSPYGKQAAHDIVGGLVRAGVCIVSGMAPGIDTLAHQTALEYGGATIGVIGTGLDEKSFFPKQNLDLARKIVNTGGCLASEYPIGFSATNYSFPRRNRIIAGLSLAIAVIEAKEKSGSLITAEWGRKQHKPVFAVPGSIYAASSSGCNWLLKNGALPCTGAGDILKIMGLAATAKSAVKSGDAKEQKILDALAAGALNLDAIIRAAGLPAQVVMSAIPIMEINGLIRNLGGGEYCLNN
jgi:DNA processing protein